MTRAMRRLLPWELHCGCPRCGVGPRERCVTVRPLHIGPWTERQLRYVGTPTSPHKPRYELWCYLFGQRVCTA